MNDTCSSVRIAALTNREKEEILKALAADLGYLLHPKSRTLCIFGSEYILAKAPVAQPFSSTQLLLFPATTSETLSSLKKRNAIQGG
jgi:hypothetical protein